MLVDVLFDSFGVTWDDLRDGAVAAEQAGFDGLWLNDHLAGSVHGARRVVECWTALTAIAATVPRVTVGPLVLNVANRDPGTLAVMAATLQEVSGGRLLLGIGAGGGTDTPYAAEQHALGRTVPGAARTAARRRSGGSTRPCGVVGLDRRRVGLPASGARAADHRRRVRPEDGGARRTCR